MEFSLAIVVGTLAGSGAYLLLGKNLFRVLIGVALIAQAANLLLFGAAGIGSTTTAVIPEGETTLPEGHPDPLAQALVLTAIVISFGVLGFCIALLKKARRNSDIFSLASVEE